MQRVYSPPVCPRLCFVGPMVGRNPGYVTTQGEFLSDLFAAHGFSVICVSSRPNRYHRLADIVHTLIRRRRDVDLQCLQVYGGPSFVVEDIASWLARRFGQRIVMHLHGGAMPRFMKRHPRWSCRVLGRADALVTPTRYLAQAVVPYGLQAQVIPNGIHLSDYPYRHRKAVRPRLFWMRSFHSIYNPKMAIRVLAHLRDTFPDARLMMAGQAKGLESEVAQLADSLGVSEAVRFPGFLDMAGKIREGEAADIAISTAHVDNTPVAVIEACAMGMPVVSTAVGGVPDLLTDEETGLLVPDDDDEAMARAIQRLVEEPALASRLSANGRELAHSFSWERAYPQWVQLFTDVMAGPRAKRRVSG
jgi:L-malate glycosyltransferase